MDENVSIFHFSFRIPGNPLILRIGINYFKKIYEHACEYESKFGRKNNGIKGKIYN